MDGQQAIFAILAGFALFLLTQTVVGWMRLTRIETRQEQHWHLLKELLELHPRKSNPGHLTHVQGDRHPHDPPEEHA